jgi:hypothetical protein
MAFPLQTERAANVKSTEVIRENVTAIMFQLSDATFDIKAPLSFLVVVQ